MKLLVDKLFYHNPNAWFGIYMRPTTNKIRTSQNGNSIITVATCSFNVVIKDYTRYVPDPRLYVFKFDKEDETKT